MDRATASAVTGQRTQLNSVNARSVCLTSNAAALYDLWSNVTGQGQGRHTWPNFLTLICRQLDHGPWLDAAAISAGAAYAGTQRAVHHPSS